MTFNLEGTLTIDLFATYRSLLHLSMKMAFLVALLSSKDRGEGGVDGAPAIHGLL